MSDEAIKLVIGMIGGIVILGLIIFMVSRTRNVSDTTSRGAENKVRQIFGMDQGGKSNP